MLIFKHTIWCSSLTVQILDRYIVLLISGDGVGIALKLVKVLNQIQEEHGWKPHRSLIFCLYVEPLNSCLETLSGYTRRRIMAYIVIDRRAFQGSLISIFQKLIF